jgi:hypothetical protein
MSISFVVRNFNTNGSYLELPLDEVGWCGI